MDRFSNKETAGNMWQGIFKFLLIGMFAVFLIGLDSLIGYYFSKDGVFIFFEMDVDSAWWCVIGIPVLLIIYWYLHKYYDKNNP